MVEVRGYERRTDGTLTIVLSNLATNQFVTFRGGGFPFDPNNAFRNHYATHIVPQTNLRLRLQERLCRGKQVRGMKCSSIAIHSHGDWTIIEIPQVDAYEALIID